MEIGDEGGRWSGSKQAKIIISPSSSRPHLKSMVMVSSWALILIIWNFLSNPNLKSFMHVWIMECGDFSFITKVRLWLYAWLILEDPPQSSSYSIVWIFARFLRNGSRIASRMESTMCSRFFSWSWSFHSFQISELSSHAPTLSLYLEFSWLGSCTNP